MSYIGRPQGALRNLIASLYLMLYGVGRFFVEFLRNDYRGSIGWMSTSQLISIGIVAAGAVLFAVLPGALKQNQRGEK